MDGKDHRGQGEQEGRMAVAGEIGLALCCLASPIGVNFVKT